MGAQVLKAELLKAIVLSLVAGVLATVAVADLTPLLEDPAKIVGDEACGECHISEHEVWEDTPHATGFRTLHRKAAAEDIAERLGLPLIKRDSVCIRCHYTPTRRNDQLRALSGVSCESCHGAGADWIDIHNDYGPGADHNTETPQHRAERIARSRAAGMRRPTDLYGVAARCFACHTVPAEELVNVGGHSTGSGGFELVAWAEGEIRHNFLDSFLNGDGTVNEMRPIERRRLMYVVGRAADLEHSLRGVAAATTDGVYVKAMIRRVRVALAEVRAIASRASLAEAQAMIDAVRGVRVGLGNRDALLAAADAVAAAGRRFATEHDGVRLAAVDPLLLGTAEDEPVAIAEIDLPPGTPADLADSLGGGAETAPAAANGSATAGGASGEGAAAPVVDPGVPAEGEKRRRIRPPSRFATVGPGTCTGCHRHSDQAAWWLDDAHYRSADRFFDRGPRAVQIARLYGLSSAQMARGNQICGQCHGTVEQGKESREMQDGVGCESCHGPAGDYLEPHQDGDPAQGDQRSGYRAALGLGMRPLADLAVRAETCTGCHYITERRLLSAGHPSGRDFDYAEAMGTIRHWQAAPAPAAAIRTAFQAVLDDRGPVPQVRLARLPSRVTAVGSATPAVNTADGGDPVGPVPRRLRSRPRSARGLATLRASGTAVDPVELPPSVDIDPDAPVEEVLRWLKERLAVLYRSLDP